MISGKAPPPGIHPELTLPNLTMIPSPNLSSGMGMELTSPSPTTHSSSPKWRYLSFVISKLQQSIVDVNSRTEEKGISLCEQVMIYARIGTKLRESG